MKVEKVELLRNTYVLSLDDGMLLITEDKCEDLVGKNIKEIKGPKKFLFYKEKCTLVFEGEKEPKFFIIFMTEEKFNKINAVLEADEWFKESQKIIYEKIGRFLTVKEMKELLEFRDIRELCVLGEYDCTKFASYYHVWETNLK